MAVFNGMNAVLRVHATTPATELGGVTSINLSISAGEIDVTDFGDTARSFIAGLASVTLSFDCLFDDADAEQDRVRTAYHGASTLEFDLTLNSGSVYDGTLSITGLTVSNGIEEAATMSVTARVTGLGHTP